MVRSLIALTALLSACALNWDYPEQTTSGSGGDAGSTSAGGAGGTGGVRAGGGTDTGGTDTGGTDTGGGVQDAPACCKVCLTAGTPPVCEGHQLDATYDSGCPVVGWAHEVGMCFEFRSCDCTNCNMLPATQLECEAFVHNTCNDCMYD